MTTSTTPAAVENLEPKPVWKLFAGIAATPRPSKREEKIRDHMLAVAKEFGFKVREEAAGNLVVEVPATPGHESAPLTVLQAHLDMVCEKNSGTAHDFDRDPIRMLMDKDDRGAAIVRADGTTLGADNGIGVAMALAAATSPDVVHGPLELLLTTDEEEGMTGAGALSADSIRGRRLLNLDSEEDDVLYIGCAGGCDTYLTWRLPLEPAGGDVEWCQVRVSGLRGGHSGGDIHQGRASATKLLVRALQRPACDVRIARLAGGSKRNAIAREAEALVCGPKGLVAALKAAGQEVCAEARAESYEPNPRIDVEAASGDAASNAAVPAKDSAMLLDALAAIPHGVLGMHPKVPGLVQSSNNLATLHCEAAGGNKLTVKVDTLARSSSASRMDEVLAQIAAIGRLSGASVETANRYPGWEPNVDSPLLATCRRIYEKKFGQPPRVEAIHAGLECGIIGQRVGGMDMISFGPHIEGAHSPDERVWIDSVKKSWEYLKSVLAELA